MPSALAHIADIACRTTAELSPSVTRRLSGLRRRPEPLRRCHRRLPGLTSTIMLVCGWRHAGFLPVPHTDTQGLPLYALAHLSGFDLMPRVRNWKGLIFYR